MTGHTGLGKELGQRTGGVMVAEVAGIVTSLGSLLLVKKIAGAERMAAAKEEIAMHVILPVLRRMEGPMTRFQQWRERLSMPSIDKPVAVPGSAGEEATQMVERAGHATGVNTGKAVRQMADVFTKPQMPLEEKARQYADALLDFSIMAPIGVATRAWVQTKADNMLGAPPIQERKWSLMGVPDTYWYAKVPEFITSNTALLAVNTVAKAPTHALTGTIEKILASTGMDQDSARNMARYTTYIQGPNMLGNFANVGYLMAVSRKSQNEAASSGHTR